MFGHLLKDKKAVVFDLDGTVVDTLALWEMAYANVLVKVSDEAFNMSFVSRGSNGRAFWEKVVNELKIDKSVDELVAETNQEFKRLFQEEPEDVDEDDIQDRVMNGFWDFAFELKEKRGMPIALVTNSDREIADFVMQELALNENVFDFTIAGDEVKRRKPAPDMYREATKRFNVNPGEVLVFEDSVDGAKAALQAGTHVVVIWSGAVSRKYYPIQIDDFLEDFSALPGKLDLPYPDYLKEELEKASQGLV